MSCWFIWTQSEEDMKNIYDEVISSTIRNKRLFYEIFEEITEGDHDFILVDKEAKNKNFKIRKNFDILLDLTDINKKYKKINPNIYIHGEPKETEKEGNKEKEEDCEKKCEKK